MLKSHACAFCLLFGFFLAALTLRGGEEHRSEIKNVHLAPVGFSDGSDGKESACNTENAGLIPELGRSPGEGNDNPLQYSCLGNAMDRGAWWATVHGVAKSWTQLSD